MGPSEGEEEADIGFVEADVRDLLGFEESGEVSGREEVGDPCSDVDANERSIRMLSLLK